MSLALSTLIYEWRRYMAAVVALAFAGLLVLAQVGLFTGIGKSFTAAIDRSSADIMVLPPNSTQLFGGGGGGGLPRRLIPLVYQHPEVVQVAPLDLSGGRFQNMPSQSDRLEAAPTGELAAKPKKQKTEQVLLMVVDPIPGYVTVPTDYSDELLDALRQPYSAAIDETAMARLGVKLGDRALYNGKTIRIAAVLRGYPNLMLPQLVVSRDTLRMLGEADIGQRVGPLLIKLRDPSQAEAVAAQLNAMGHGQYRAWTRQGLADENEKGMFENGILVVILGFSALMGAFIGIVITWQTLQAAVLANIKEFASLRALGVSMTSLRRIVMELSLWVGVVGVLAAGVLVWAISLLARLNGVPMGFPLFIVVGVTVFLLGVAMLSGLLSLGILSKSQPADLLR